MQHPTAPVFPLLDKSCLFVHLPTQPNNPNRYLQCTATGHLYSMSTGSLYPVTINPLFDNSPEVKNLPIQGTSSPMSHTDPNVKNTNPPRQGKSSPMRDIVSSVKNVAPLIHRNGASKSLNNQKNKSPTVKHGDQPVQASVNSSSISKDENNRVININNAYKPVENHNAVSSPKTTCQVKHANLPIQGDKHTVISYMKCKKKSNLKMEGHSTQVTSALTKSKDKASRIKTEIPTQTNVPVPSVDNTSMGHQYATINEKKKKLNRNKNNSSTVPPQDNSCVCSKKISDSSKKNKSTLPLKPKTTGLFMNYCLSFKTRDSISQTAKQYDATLYPDLSVKNKTKTYTYYKYYLIHTIKVIHPIQINLEDLIFPQMSLPLNQTKFSRKYAEGYTEIIQVSLPDKSTPKYPKKEKPPSLCFRGEDCSMICLENNFKKKTTKKKSFGKVSYSFKTIWAVLKPFNRRPNPHHVKQKPLLSIQGKNCIMASSVHEIIHSRFAKNGNEHMPGSQIRALLSSGDRKLRMRNEWIQQMEEEAIQKYIKMNLEKHKQRLQVQKNDILHHKEKFWLACSSRSVINRKNKESWPLLVKCIHKYPDSTLREACKHRSFCLRWNGTSYTLRLDHAYYTQIQCHMAVTDTSYAELIVHTHKETTVLPVYFDTEFWKQAEATLEMFYTNNISPYLEKNQIVSSALLDTRDSSEILEE